MLYPYHNQKYLQLFEGTDENMNDEADSLIGNDAAINNTDLQIQASMMFEQKL